METKAETVKIDPSLRRKGLMNSALLGLQFAVISFTSFKAGSNLFGVIGLLATIGTINDALSFYYANKQEK